MKQQDEVSRGLMSDFNAAEDASSQSTPLPVAKTNYVEKVSRRFTQLFADVRSPERKSARGSKAGVELPPTPRGTLDNEACSWIAKTIGKGMIVIAEETAARFETLEQRTTEVEGRMDTMDGWMREVGDHMPDSQEGATLRKQVEKQEEEIVELRKAMELLKSRPAPRIPSGMPSPAGSAASPASAASSGTRTQAIVGSLGWDVPEKELCERGKLLLKEAKVEESTWHTMTPGCRPDGVGSLCNVHFESEDALSLARDKVRLLQKQFPSANSKAFVDIKKTFTERRPTRQIRMAHQLLLQYLDQSKYKPEELELVVKLRAIDLCKVRAGWLGRDGELHLTEAMTAAVGDDKADQVCDLVSGCL